MTQKQLDALKELGFTYANEYYSLRIRTTIMSAVVISVDDKNIVISIKGNWVNSYPFTLTKLREIVSKLEKL